MIKDVIDSSRNTASAVNQAVRKHPIEKVHLTGCHMRKADHSHMFFIQATPFAALCLGSLHRTTEKRTSIWHTVSYLKH